MKNRWIWTVVAAIAGSVLLFAAAVFIVSRILGEDQRLVMGGGVGLVEVKGLIIDSQETVKQLHEFARDDRVKSVVLRIESPGGVVGPSQEIYAEVKKLASKKKVVVSMGSVAASGGYYIAAPASMIFANPGTITGSIGVLMKFTNVEGLMGKIGVKAFTLKTGKYKDAGSPLRPMSDEEKAMLQGVIDNTREQFVNAVAEGRKLPREQVAGIADGRIFTGEQAKQAKLVDKLGTLQDAVEEAARLAGIKGEPQLIRPPKKKKVLLDLLAEETASRIGSVVRKESGLDAGGFSINYEVSGAGN